MADMLELQGNEVACTANTSVANAVFVRVHNIAGSAEVLTVAYANAVQYANLTMMAGEVLYIRKGSTDTIQGTSVVASSVKIW